MDNYKMINRELVEQVQEMRQSLASYQKQILSLKRELMLEYEMRLELRRLCVSLVWSNCVKVLEKIEPDSDLLRHMMSVMAKQDSKRGCWNSSNCAEMSTAAGHHERSGNERKRSSVIVQELRRSNALLENQRAMRSMSPAGRRSCAVEEAEEERGSGSDEESADEEEARRATEPQTGIQTQTGSTNSSGCGLQFECIYEANEEECPEDVEEVTTVEKRNMVTRRRHVLNDVTNIAADATCVEPQNGSTEGGRKLGNHRKTKQVLNDSNVIRKDGSNRNESANDSLGSGARVHQDPGEGRGEPSHCVESIEVARQTAAAPQKENSLPPPNLERLGAESRQDVCSPSLALSEFSLGQFEDATSSTPFSSKNETTKNTGHHLRNTNQRRLNITEEAGGLSQSPSISNLSCARPQRSCKPKTLIEPSLMVKMRNEEVKKRPRSKRKPCKKSAKG